MSTAKKPAPAKEQLYGVILAPVITEKATAITGHSQYAFKVRRDAAKPLIKAAVESLFNVKVTAVNTINMRGKAKRFRGRLGHRQDSKKAIVTLAQGQTIDVTTGV